MPPLTATHIIEVLHLEPLPIEGGFFRRTYRAEEKIAKTALPDRYPHAKYFGSAIYYLLDAARFSSLHRLLTDEVYHFYLGDPVEMLLLYPDGRSEVIILGPNLEAGNQVQFVVPRGTWQGARLQAGGRFALLGTTMAPAWDESDLELGRQDELIQQYVDRVELIRTLARE